MGSIQSSIKGWKTAATRLAVLLALQALGLGAGWSQEIPPPRLDEEFAEQEKIYRSRGADVPSGYVTGRGLSDYAELLPSGFCDTLSKLGSSDRWLDIGAGAGQAILDYYAPQGGAPSGAACAPPGDKARAVAVSIEDRRTDKWRQQAASLGDDHIRYVSGKRLCDSSPEEPGRFTITSDVFGCVCYSSGLYQFGE